MSSQEFVDMATIFGVIASSLSIILALFAIWQAWQFYSKAKDSERRTEIAFTEIKAQTETLQKLTGTQIKNLTKAVTQQSPTEKALIDMLSSLNSQGVTNISTEQVNSDLNVAKAEMIGGFIGTYHYAALCNNLMSYAFKNTDNPEVQRLYLHWLDYSYNDFMHMERVVSTIPSADLQTHTMNSLYKNTLQNFKPWVVSSTMVQTEESGRSA